MKNNLSYYRHDVSSDDHWKFKMLRVLFEQEFNIDGWAGEGRFWALNNRIARSEDCHLDYTDEIQKLADAADFKFSLDQYDKFLDILINKCRLVKISDDGTFYTDYTQMLYSGVQEDRENARQRKQNSRSKNTDGQKKSHQTSNPSQVTLDMSHSSHIGHTDSHSVTNQESRVEYSRVEKSKVKNPDSDESVLAEKNSDLVVGVITGEDDISGLARGSKRNKKSSARKPKTGVEPYQRMYMTVFTHEWQHLRKTENKYHWIGSEVSNLKLLAKELRGSIEPWSIEDAESEFKKFICKAKKHPWVSKDNFLNFNFKTFINRCNEISTINDNQNGQSGQKNWKSDVDRRPLIDPNVKSSGKF